MYLLPETEKELEILSRNSVLPGEGRRAQVGGSGQGGVCQHQGWPWCPLHWLPGHRLPPWGAPGADRGYIVCRASSGGPGLSLVKGERAQDSRQPTQPGWCNSPWPSRGKSSKVEIKSRERDSPIGNLRDTRSHSWEISEGSRWGLQGRKAFKGQGGSDLDIASRHLISRQSSEFCWTELVQ